jgi:hypothetical protein
LRYHLQLQTQRPAFTRQLLLLLQRGHGGCSICLAQLELDVGLLGEPVFMVYAHRDVRVQLRPGMFTDTVFQGNLQSRRVAPGQHHKLEGRRKPPVWQSAQDFKIHDGHAPAITHGSDLPVGRGV